MTPSEILHKLQGIADSSSDKKKNGTAGIVTSVVMAIIAMAAFAVFAFVSTRNARELARLRHEKNKAEILRVNRKTRAALADSEEKRAGIQASVDALSEQISEVEADIGLIESARKEDEEAIDSIKSWSDI